MASTLTWHQSPLGFAGDGETNLGGLLGRSRPGDARDPRDRTVCASATADADMRVAEVFGSPAVRTDEVDDASFWKGRWTCADEDDASFLEGTGEWNLSSVRRDIASSSSRRSTFAVYAGLNATRLLNAEGN